MRFRYYFAYVLIIALSITAYITWRVGAADVFRLLGAANKECLAFYLVVSVLIAVFLTLKWSVVLHAQGASVPFHRLFGYRLVGYSVNYLTPTMHVGSEPIRAYLLKKEGIPIEKAFANVIIDKSVELATNVLFFFIGALIILNSVAVSVNMKRTMLAVSMLFMLLFGLAIGGILGKQSMFVWLFRKLQLHRIKKFRTAERSLARIERGVEIFYRTKKKHFLALFGIMILLWCLMYLEYRSILLFLGLEASPVQIFLILTGVGIAYSIPVPAAIGTLELGQLSAAKVLDMGSVTGVTLAFIIRSRDLAWTIIGLLFTAVYEFNFTRLARKTRQIDRQFEEGEILSAGRR